MRIGAGRYKGKKIASSDLPNLRPTLGRVKETFFAIIGNHVDMHNAHVLDVFAGTGNLGLEALSLGAEKITFIENNDGSLRLVNSNIRAFDVSGQCEIIKNDAVAAIEQLINQKRRFDLIIMDPPFRQDFLNTIINTTHVEDLLTEEGMLACETEKKYQFKNNEKWDIIKERKIADSMLFFLKKRS